MRIMTIDFDGQPLGEVDLTRSADGRATVNGLAVLAMRSIGSRVALLAGGRQYCVATADHWRVMGVAGSATARPTKGREAIAMLGQPGGQGAWQQDPWRSHHQSR